MKFKCSVEIDRPIDQVIELFDDRDNLKKWQEGFVSIEHLSGTKGEPGAKSKLIYKQGNRDMELIETIEVKDLPNIFKALYEHKLMTNTMSNTFTSIDETRTRWNVTVHYTKFNGLIPKLMAFLFPGIFKKQTQKWLDKFKAFAERK